MMLKVLCLHGYRQDSVVFKQKSGGFRKQLKTKAEFVFMDAPHLVPTGEQNPTESTSFRSWWFSEEEPENAFYSMRPSNCSKGFNESVDAIKRVFETQGPFDGLLGFSQGAAMAALICGLKQQRAFEPSFRFVVLGAGFRSRSSSHSSLYEEQILVPSLHIIGENDKVILREVSDELTENFSSPSVVYHPGGHCIPSSGTHKTTYFDFLNRFG